MAGPGAAVQEGLQGPEPLWLNEAGVPLHPHS